MMANGTKTGMTSGANMIQTIDKDGGIALTYYFKSTGQGANKKWGWQTEKGVKITSDNDVNIARGDGFVLNAQAAEITLTSAGAVDTNKYTYAATVAGKNIMANPFPATIKLSKIDVMMPNDTKTGMTSGANMIQTIDKDGGIALTYYFKSTGQGANKKWGWQTEKGVKITSDNDVDILLGAAFKLNAQVAGLKVIMSM